MFSLWTSFMEMVELLFTFIHATRVGDYMLLHLFWFREMCPLIFTYDHTNYPWYGVYYYRSIKLLEETQPQVYEHLQNGHFAIEKSQINSHGKIPEDQAIEETINKRSTVSGGVGKHRNIESI